jgi:RND family efflux transporter MFP subunit
MNNRHLITVVGLSILIVLMSSCKDDRQDTEHIRPIKTITVKDAAAGKVRKFSGIVKATEYSRLSFEVGGMVQSVQVDIGDHVEKEQQLAVLDDEPYRLEVDAAQAELDKAIANEVNTKAEYERQQRVFEQGAGTQNKLDQAKYDYDAALSSHAYNVSQLKLANVEPHEEIQAGRQVFDIDAVGEMEVVLAVPETNISQIHTDTAATLTFPTLPGISVKGNITEIGSAAIKANAFPVKIALMNPPAAINPGMTAEASLILFKEGQSTGFLVPLQSLVPSEKLGHGYVFVYEPATSIVKKTPVRIRSGWSEKNMMVIEEGLAAGDIIATAGVSYLIDGMKVKLLEK